jgi:hypothetical protein
VDGIIRELHPQVPAGRRLRAGLAVLAAAVLLPACAAAMGDTPELEPGRYAFDGEGRLTHAMRSGAQVEIIHVSGTFEVHTDGEIDAFAATAGACRPSPARVGRRGAMFDCGGTTLLLGSRTGTARVPALQRYEVRGGCRRFETDAQGRPTNRCLDWSWNEENRRTQVNVPLTITRTSSDID